MNIYNARIDRTGEELGIVARTMDHAAEVFVCFWIARTGSPPGKFDIGSGPPSPLIDNVVIPIIEAGDVAGVVVVLDDGSTTFDPATS